MIWIEAYEGILPWPFQGSGRICQRQQKQSGYQRNRSLPLSRRTHPAQARRSWASSPRIGAFPAAITEWEWAQEKIFAGSSNETWPVIFCASWAVAA